MSVPGVPRDAPVILALAPNQWDGPLMNRQQLLSRVGCRYPVIYATGLPQPGRRKGPKGGWLTGRLLRRDNVHLDCPPQWMVRPGRPAWLTQCADVLMAARWRRQAARLSRGLLTAYVFHPKFWPLMAHLRPARLVYHAYDLYHLQGGAPDEIERRERALVHAANLVVASSEAIAEHLRSLGAGQVEVVENAADYELFAGAATDGAPEPSDLAAIGHPRIGYTGALNRKVDFALAAQLAGQFPQWQFVFVGRIGNLDASCERAVEELRQRSNVYFLGFKAPTDLPMYVAGMDVNTMWYRLGPDVWTAGIYPLKLHEYLAAGRPVVSADLPSIRPFADVVRIARDPQDWAQALIEAVAGRGAGSEDLRRLRARDNNWTSRADRLERLLARMFTAAESHTPGDAV